MNMIMNFLKDEEGAVMAEYGILLVLIAVALLGAITAFSGQIIAAFGRATAILSTGATTG